MTLTARDKNIAIAIGTVVLLAVVFFALVKPLWLDNRSIMLSKIQRETFNYNSDKEVLDNEAKTRMTWESYKSNGLQDNPTDEIWAAETLVQQIARSSGVNVDQQRTTRIIPYKEGKTETDFTEYQFMTVATGNSFGLGRFLLALEESRFPLKIEDLVVRSHKPGVNDLGIQVNISVLVYTPKVTTRPASTRAGRSSSTHPSTMTATTGPSGSGLSVDEIEAQLRARREKELNAPPSSQPAATMPAPGAAAPNEFTPGAPGFTSGAGFTPGAGMTPAATTTAPAESAADIAARMRARREQDQMTGAIPAATQPTTQPTGGVR